MPCHFCQKAIARFAVLGNRIAGVYSVKANSGSGKKSLGLAAGARQRLSQMSGGIYPAGANALFLFLRPQAEDALTGEMDHRAVAAYRFWIQRLERVPGNFVRPRGLASFQANDFVAIATQGRDDSASQTAGHACAQDSHSRDYSSRERVGAEEFLAASRQLNSLAPARFI
jgi:hypothetical protein